MPDKSTHSRLSDASLHVFGAALIDEVVRPSGQLQPGASNPVTVQQRLGGVGCNVARSAALTRHYLGHESASVYLHAAAGCDATANSLEKSLSNAGLRAHLQRISGASTGRYTVVLDNTGDLHIGLASTALYDELTVESFVSPHLQVFGNHPAFARHVLLDANLPAPVLHELCKGSKNHQPVGSIAAMAVSPAKAVRWQSLIPAIDLLFCNVREAQTLVSAEHAGPLKAEDLANELHEQGLQRAVITDGGNPVIILDKETTHRLDCPTPPATATSSVNGAGDALAGATWVAWLDGKPLVDAVRHHGFPAAGKVLSGENEAPLLDQ